MALQFQWTPPVSLLQVETKLSASPPSEETTSLERGGEESERPKKQQRQEGGPKTARETQKKGMRYPPQKYCDTGEPWNPAVAGGEGSGDAPRAQTFWKHAGFVGWFCVK